MVSATGRSAATRPARTGVQREQSREHCREEQRDLEQVDVADG